MNNINRERGGQKDGHACTLKRSYVRNILYQTLHTEIYHSLLLKEAMTQFTFLLLNNGHLFKEYFFDNTEKSENISITYFRKAHYHVLKRIIYFL